MKTDCGPQQRCQQHMDWRKVLR